MIANLFVKKENGGAGIENNLVTVRGAEWDKWRQ